MSQPAQLTLNDWTAFQQFYNFLIPQCREHFTESFDDSWDGSGFYLQLVEVDESNVLYEVEYNGGRTMRVAVPVEYFIAKQNDVQSS